MVIVHSNSILSCCQIYFTENIDIFLRISVIYYDIGPPSPSTWKTLTYPFYNYQFDKPDRFLKWNKIFKALHSTQ